MESPGQPGDPAPADADIVFEQSFIVIYRALDAALCCAVIDRFDRDDRKHRGRIGRLGGDFFSEDETKRSWDLAITPDGAWRDLFEQIHPKIHACISDYLSRSPVLQSFDLQSTGYKIQMYPQNDGYFRWHADSVGRNARDRVVAMVLYLNDVDQGGDTEFFHQGIKVAPKTGHLVLFPTGWNYMHCGHTPESGHKYIIQTFIQIKNPTG